ncbi:MAG TPA: hypothetical protein VGK48_10660 [Terriglobia bacterium]|jgi:hypothetical protein
MLLRLTSKAPAAGIAVAFTLTVLSARIVSLVDPGFHFNVNGIHIHHYVYGIFILAIAGYLALIFRGDGARPWIAMLYGLGIGFTFDEFGMWSHPVFQRNRWDRTGLTIVVIALLMVGVLLPRLARKSQNRLEIPPSNTVEVSDSVEAS